MSENTLRTNVKSVLLVDDDERFRERLAEGFVDRGWEVRQSADGKEAICLANDDSPEFAVIDLRMPEMGGLELLKALHEIDPATRILVLTGYGSIATAIEAVRRGAVHYLTKPAGLREIIQSLHHGTEGHMEPDEHEAPVPSLARAEWEHIQRVLTDCDGNISKTAKLLGLHRRSLQRKLSKFPVSR